MSCPGETDYYADYSVFLEARQKWIEADKNAPTRYVAIEDRKNEYLPTEILKLVEHGKYRSDWDGVLISKDPLDMGIFQAMLGDIRPRTIIEIGVLRGGSAIWFADHVKMFDLDCHVIGFDRDYSHLHEKAKSRKDITFLTGDCKEIEKVFTVEFLKRCAHPWIVIEDAHACLEHVMDHFNKHMETGDYLVVEDGHPGTVVNSFDVLNQETAGVTWGPNKLMVMKEFLVKHPGNLKVDTFYNDFYGYNMTFNVNGYLRKM